ncbi:MAG: cell division protein FtsZ [Bacteroidaceae bacterium]|nr:cell division protein FtsZ [Bacteroidaceae bacterium]
MEEKEILPFRMNTPIDNTTNIIKVIGVGGGGGNAVNHMFNEGIENITFALCNTDNQALIKSDIDTKLQLGPSITHGLGAGNNPSRAEEAANESKNEIQELLEDGTKMVFITAGMGGGTGTGAAPVVAKIAKDMGILTIGIVTLPFVFEGVNKILQAIEGIEKLKKNVDAMLIINNELLRHIYSDWKLDNAFKKADSTLSVAARSIVEIITREGVINLDFADVDTTLRDGGVAIISSGYGSGEGRIKEAIDDALQSPLLDNSKIVNTDRILINLTFSAEANVTVEEMTAVHDFMRTINTSTRSFIWGYGIDETLGDRIKITILAAGFDSKQFTDKARNSIAQGRESINTDESSRTKISEYYPSNTPVVKKKNHIYLFDIDEIGDETLITKIDETPTYKRTKEMVELLHKEKENRASEQMEMEDNNI